MKTSLRSIIGTAGAVLLFGWLAAPACADILYLPNSGNNTIEKFTPDGVRSVFASSEMRNPIGVVFDSAGNLFVVDDRDNTIWKYTPDGVGSVFASGSHGLVGLAFDSAGNLYAANSRNNTIEKYTPGGVGSVFASSGLTRPECLAFDTEGHLYVSNSGNNTIVKFTPTASARSLPAAD